MALVFVPVTNKIPATWASFYQFSSVKQGTRVDAAGRVVGFWRTSISPQRLAFLNAQGVVGEYELRTIRTDADTGNQFYWLSGYATPQEIVFGLKTVKAYVEFDDGRQFDITNINIDRDANGQSAGVPYALFNVIDGYRVKIWFTQHDPAGYPTILNYWEQKYTYESVFNPKWGTSGATVPCIVQRQTAWQIKFDDRYASQLKCSVPGAWKLNPPAAGGQMAMQTFKIGAQNVNIVAPTGVGTLLPWMSANGLGKGLGWVSDTGTIKGYLANVT